MLNFCQLQTQVTMFTVCSQICPKCQSVQEYPHYNFANIKKIKMSITVYNETCFIQARKLHKNVVTSDKCSYWTGKSSKCIKTGELKKWLHWPVVTLWRWSHEQVMWHNTPNKVCCCSIKYTFTYIYVWDGSLHSLICIRSAHVHKSIAFLPSNSTFMNWTHINYMTNISLIAFNHTGKSCISYQVHFLYRHFFIEPENNWHGYVSVVY